MPDYSKGKIYTIRCYNDTSLIYVGSTTQQLSQRWTDHKQHSTQDINKNRLIYKTIDENGIDSFYIELYEDFPCANKQELQKREGEVMRQIATINMVVPGRTIQEYQKDNKERLNEINRRCYHNNVEKFKERKKEYYENNKEKILEKSKESYLKNRDEIRKKENEKVKCECGCMISRGNLSEHKHTKKHIELMCKTSN